MQRLEVSGAVRPLYGSFGVKGLNDFLIQIHLDLKARVIWATCDNCSSKIDLLLTSHRIVIRHMANHYSMASLILFYCIRKAI